MLEHDFVDCIIEKRLEMLMDKKKILSEDELILEMEKILGNDISTEIRTVVGLLINRIKNDEKEIYKMGVDDGIKITKWICGN